MKFVPPMWNSCTSYCYVPKTIFTTLSSLLSRPLPPQFPQMDFIWGNTTTTYTRKNFANKMRSHEYNSNKRRNKIPISEQMRGACTKTKGSGKLSCSLWKRQGLVEEAKLDRRGRGGKRRAESREVTRKGGKSGDRRAECKGEKGVERRRQGRR